MTSISLSATATGKADAVVVGVYATETAKGGKGLALAPGAEAVDAAYGGALAKALDLVGAAGKDGELTRLPAQGDVKAPLIVAVGLGKKPAKGAAPSLDTLRKSAAAAARSLAGKGKAVFALPAGDAAQAGAVAEGVLLGVYSWEGLKAPRKDAKGALGEAVLATPAAKPAAAKKALQKAVDHAVTVAGAVNLARDLINTPPSHLYPQTFAERALTEVKDAGLAGLSIEVLDEKALTEGGYGGIMGIGKGSAKPPRLVRLAYRHPKAKKHLALVGKGITFDTGGISLKPANAMDTMKSDMSGAAAVFSATLAVARQEVPVNITTYLSLAENMPGGGAIKVSDVITMYGGKTVEVMNTDAEGRVVMADALARASEDQPDLLLDVATLTGAQVLALDRLSAVMGNDDELRTRIVETAKAAGEEMWPMPLPEYLRETIDTQSADISNMGQRMGGMLVAGLFLREFVGEGIKWAHLDIAGASFNEKAPYGDTPKGGTGAAVRTLVRLAEDLGAGK
jgi:leucyl aminopeptidase